MPIENRQAHPVKSGPFEHMRGITGSSRAGGVKKLKRSKGRVKKGRKAGKHPGKTGRM